MSTSFSNQGSLRLTATLPRALHSNLIRRADYEGRSLSNLVAYLLESSMEGYEQYRR